MPNAITCYPFSIVPRAGFIERLPLPPMDGEAPCPRAAAHFWVGKADVENALGAIHLDESNLALDPDCRNPIRDMDEFAAQCFRCYAIRGGGGEIAEWDDIAPDGLDGVPPIELMDCLIDPWRLSVMYLRGHIKAHLNDPHMDAETAAALSDDLRRAEEVGFKLGFRYGEGEPEIVTGMDARDPRVFIEWEPGDLYL